MSIIKKVGFIERYRNKFYVKDIMDAKFLTIGGFAVVLIVGILIAILVMVTKTQKNVSANLPNNPNNPTNVNDSIALPSDDLATWPAIFEWDLPGHDIGNPKGNVTSGQCQRLCDYDPTCVAATFDSNLKACWLKDSLSVTQPTLPGNRAIYLKPVKKSKLKKVTGTQINGDDLFTISTPSATECGMVCDYNSYCKAASFLPDGNRCILKRTGLNPKPNYNATTFLMA